MPNNPPGSKPDRAGAAAAAPVRHARCRITRPDRPLRDQRPRKQRTISAERIRGTRSRFTKPGPPTQGLDNLSDNRRSGGYHGFRFRHSDAFRFTRITIDNDPLSIVLDLRKVSVGHSPENRRFRSAEIAGIAWKHTVFRLCSPWISGFPALFERTPSWIGGLPSLSGPLPSTTFQRLAGLQIPEIEPKTAQKPVEGHCRLRPVQMA